MTGVSLSSNVLRELKEEGRTDLKAQTKVAGMVSETLTRNKPQSVPFKVILTDEPVKIAAIHVRRNSIVGNREYWILEHTVNPLVLGVLYNGKAFYEVVKLSFPTDERAARLERNLSEQGYTVVYAISFDFASDRIEKESEPALKEMTDLMTNNPTWRKDL